MKLLFGQLIPQGGHLPPKAQFAFDDPVMDLLVGVFVSALALIQGWGGEFVGIPFRVFAMAGAQTRPNT